VQLLLSACEWLADTRVGTQIRESDHLFSVIETVHVLGITVTAGTIAIVDLRILGIVLSRRALSHVLAPLVKITWIGFFVMAASGTLLFLSEADKLYFNRAFRTKLLLLGLAGINQWLFHAFHNRDFRTTWMTAEGEVLPSAKLAASFSLGLWLGVIVLGRAIAYV
jgi:hypothetical protein